MVEYVKKQDKLHCLYFVEGVIFLERLFCSTILNYATSRNGCNK